MNGPLDKTPLLRPHEALHVASGRRLVLLAFLFGDR